MAYCRWSSDDHRCDVYAYADARGGWTVHLARNRFRDVPRVDWQAEPEECARQIDAQIKATRSNPSDPIGGPRDGATLKVETLAAFHALLVELRTEGYQFPDDVFDRVGVELADEARAADHAG